MPKKAEPAEKIPCKVAGCEFEGDKLEMMNHLISVHEFKDTDALQYCYPAKEVQKTVLDAAREAGAVEVIDAERIARMDDSEADDDVKQAFQRAPGARDLLGTGKLDFHKNLPQVDFDNLVNHEFLIKEIKLVEDWDGYYGTSTFALLQVLLKNGTNATTLAGGIAIVKQIRKMLSIRRFPVRVTLTESPGQGGKYKLFE